MFAIYSLIPAKDGIEHRLVEIFERKADAELVLKVLEFVNVSLNTYQIMEETSPLSSSPPA